MATFEDHAAQVFDIAESIWPGRVHRTFAAAQATALRDRAALDAYEARRHPGDRLRGLGPLEGTADDIALATPLRWRACDVLHRDLQALERALAAESLDAEHRALALQLRWYLQRKQDRMHCRVMAAWWLEHTDADAQQTIRAL